MSASICGSRCPKHDHVCQRTPQHQAGICRDRKQKGTESCTWDSAQLNATAQGLARLVAGRDGCWLIRSFDDCALLVPEAGRLVFRRSFKAPTVAMAVRLGLVQVGEQPREVPAFVGRPKWLDHRRAVVGRTITAAGAK